MTRVWHDDIRPAPNGWEWARTNDQAKQLLLGGDVDEISLDHDLGLANADPNRQRQVLRLIKRGRHARGETGLDLVRWMCEQDCVPARVRIHSWNWPGREEMARVLAEYGCVAVVEPFKA